MINLFEYQNKERYEGDFEGLDSFLDEIWKNRELNPYFQNNGKGTNQGQQQFINFLYRSKQLKSKNYIGCIRYEGNRINLFPKIAYSGGNTQFSHKGINLHILWWLSYSSKIKFPKHQTTLGQYSNDFFEILVYLFAKYTRELLSHSIYQQYQEQRQEMQYVRGRLDVNRYISKNLSRGRWHKVNCIYDPYILDNLFNRIIKYVARFLFKQTDNTETSKYLREIIFLLDDVSDVRVTANDCDTIHFNPALSEFEIVRDYCKLFLDHTISLDYNNDLKLFAFLIPMESLFEDFISGFLKKELKDIKVTPQASTLSLDEGDIFSIKPDILIEQGEYKLLADTKYKVVKNKTDDSKMGISHSDMYQMVSYAVRFGIEKVLMIYPNTIDSDNLISSLFSVKDAFIDSQEITIKACQVPLLNKFILKGDFKKNASISELFKSSRLQLSENLRSNITSF